jgi:hypothetical protein
MNVEELKLITEAVTSLGAEGKEAFMWYLMTTVVTDVVWALVIGFIGYGVFSRLGKAIGNAIRVE